MPPPPDIPPPVDLRKANKLCLTRLLGATNVSHVPGSYRERFLLCGAGAAWSLGCEPGDPPRFLPAGVSMETGVSFNCLLDLSQGLKSKKF